MSEVTSRIPFDRTTGKYKKDWHATQEEQVSESSLTGHYFINHANFKLYHATRMPTMIECVAESTPKFQTTSKMASSFVSVSQSTSLRRKATSGLPRLSMT